MIYTYVFIFEYKFRYGHTNKFEYTYRKIGCDSKQYHTIKQNVMQYNML